MEYDLLFEKLDYIIYLLSVLDGCILFIIGCITAILVVYILYSFLKKCISKI